MSSMGAIAQAAFPRKPFILSLTFAGMARIVRFDMLDREDWLYLGLFIALMTAFSLMVWAAVEWVF